VYREQADMLVFNKWGTFCDFVRACDRCGVRISGDGPRFSCLAGPEHGQPQRRSRTAASLARQAALGTLGDGAAPPTADETSHLAHVRQPGPQSLP
jgi:hypothetical protein